MLCNLQRRDEQPVNVSLIPFYRWHKAKEWLAEVNSPRDWMQLSWLSAQLLNHTFSPHLEPSWQNKGIYTSKSNPALARRWTIESLEVSLYHSSGRKITFPPGKCRNFFFSTVLVELSFPSKRVGLLVFLVGWVFLALLELKTDGKLTADENYSCMASR